MTLFHSLRFSHFFKWVSSNNSNFPFYSPYYYVYYPKFFGTMPLKLYLDGDFDNNSIPNNADTNTPIPNGSRIFNTNTNTTTPMPNGSRISNNGETNTNINAPMPNGSRISNNGETNTNTNAPIPNGSCVSSNDETLFKITSSIKKEAQSALLDYLHSTRNLPFLEAEHISKNSPLFLRKLIHNAGFDYDVGHCIARFLRYHPINEFEPFFESIGLDPFEFVPLLPPNLMFLSDEGSLLQNYCLLCEYGVARDDIGKVYRIAREVFHDCNGGLKSMLRGFEEVGISRHVIAKAVCFNPCLLNDGKGIEFFKVVVKLQCLDCGYDWVEHNVLENGSYNWRRIIELLNVSSDLGCNNQELGNLVRQHPELLFDRSGQSNFTLIGFLVKLGFSKAEICSLFLQFPQVKVGKFVWNLGRAFEMFNEIEMDNASIASIIRTHVLLLGSCSLKKANSILNLLNTGKRRVCEIIRNNPLELKNWVLRAKLERLPGNRGTRLRKRKIKFLSSIGFSENSKEMERALKLFRGKAEELQERYECLVEAGLSEEDVARMIKLAPQILNQSKDVIEAKIRYLVCDLGYPISSLKPFPGCIAYTIERVKLRCSMYQWLVNENAVPKSLALSSIIGNTESYFVTKYVNKHPGGFDVWQELKKTYSVQK